MTDTTNAASQPLLINATIDTISISFDESFDQRTPRNRILISYTDKDTQRKISKIVSLKTLNQIQIKNDQNTWVTYDIVKGSSGANTIGLLTGDTTGRPRIILSGRGDDLIFAADGDIIDGGTGSDLVVIQGHLSDYSGSWRVDGTYVLTNNRTQKKIVMVRVETVQFMVSDFNGNYSEILNLGTKGVNKFNYDPITTGYSPHFDGGAAIDRLTMKLPNVETSLGNFSLSLEGGEIKMTNLKYQSTAYLKNIEQLAIQPYGSRTAELYDIIISQDSTDISNSGMSNPNSSLVFGGDEGNSVHLKGNNLYLDLGGGNDSAADAAGSPASHVFIHGGTGNDFYQYENLEVLDYSHSRNIDHVTVTMSYGGGNSYQDRITVQKYNGTAAQGTDTILTSNGGVSIITGDGDDEISITGIGGAISPEIDAGGGTNKIKITNANGTWVFLGNGKNSIDAVNSDIWLFFMSIYSQSLTLLTAKGYSVDIARHISKFYNGTENIVSESTWSLDYSSHATYDFSDNNFSDTVMGSNLSDTVFLGQGDTANLAGASDEVVISGNASVDGGVGNDTITFALPGLWQQSLSPGMSREKLSFTLDIASGKATWTRTDKDNVADSLTSQFQNFENYVIGFDVGAGSHTNDYANHIYTLDSMSINGSHAGETIELNNLHARTTTITGNGGDDTFVFSDNFPSSSARTINITDFVSNNNVGDKIDLTNIGTPDGSEHTGKWLHVLLKGSTATVIADGSAYKLFFSATNHTFAISDFVIDSTFTTIGKSR